MNRLLLIVCLALAATLCLSAVSEAHKVNIFAYVEGDTIVTDSGYSRSKRVNDGVVEVHDGSSGELLLSGNTDEAGLFTFVIPKEARERQVDLRLLLKAGTGHQAEWTVKYDEFADAPRPVNDVVVEDPVQASPTATEPQPAATVPAGALTESQVEAIVRRELAPLNRMVAEMHDSGPSLVEIFGGIGWIFGLFGVAAYMKSRKP
ncbi:hypothetical protein [Pseudodesulfovibrio indicus]|uniref:hypothetical protein n=1 Tax=Pseudodesulfovibrio indicus TaxID=1716143 RepID=UPI00293136D5|nr:hypothetical protein [Pseudodesulfovibrio indicus]